MKRLQILSSQLTADKPKMVTTTIDEARKIALVEMTPPGKLVVLSRELFIQLNEALLSLEKDDRVNAVVLTGKGKAFAAGAAITEFEGLDLKQHLFDDYFERGWFTVLPKYRKPTIAAINGFALGGGLEVAMMCDMQICSDDAKLGQPEIKLGLIPGGGGCVRLTQAVGKSKAMEMILTGVPISAQEALSCGLVSQVHPKDKLVENAMNLAAKIATFSKTAAALCKRAVRQSLELGESAGIDHERTLFATAMGTADKKEGVDAFLKKRKPNFN